MTWKRRKQEYLGALSDLHQRYGAGVASEEFRRAPRVEQPKGIFIRYTFWS